MWQDSLQTSGVRCPIQLFSLDLLAFRQWLGSKWRLHSLMGEISSAKMHGAEGIGLYRTEILYLNRKDLPTEEEHFQTYRRLVEDIYPATATIRTLDIGGDKFLPDYSKNNELNPALGLRAIRSGMTEVDVFKTQLRGILRAGV